MLKKIAVGGLACLALAGGLFLGGSAISMAAHGHTSLLAEWAGWEGKELVDKPVDETTDPEDEEPGTDAGEDAGTETMSVMSNGRSVIVKYAL